ncbi:MAG: hypothetical protein NVV72_08710 [Asticcacaulis sp.]|nr:hypothetical protein [Asticcacaulis sp.]
MFPLSMAAGRRFRPSAWNSSSSSRIVRPVTVVISASIRPWNPVTDVYSATAPIVGTIVSSFLALLFALPIAIGVAVFLTQFCPRYLAQPLSTAVELLAGIPSIVYGMWGLFVFAPGSPRISRCR